MHFLISSLDISKSGSVEFIVTTLQLSHISVHVIIIFLSNFPITFLTFTYFLNIYTFSNLSLSLTFSSPTTLYLNITLFFLSFFFPVLSYSHPFTINLSFSLLFFTYFSLTTKKRFSLSLSLNFLVDFFIFLSSLLQVDKLLCSLELYIKLM